VEGAELRLFQEALDQVELADRLGIDYAWEVEHHFLEEYSHSSAPEVFLGACSQRTRRIRLGHGIVLMPPGYNHPARVAERIATLDLVSWGRVEWGTGQSASAAELGGFRVDPDERHAMWLEATAEAANMLVMDPYPGYQGKYFSMPCRNLVPKSVQKPHPPLWVACSRRDTIHQAARHGIGALTFAFIDQSEAARWVQEYYDIVKSDECVPIGHAVNANVAMVAGFSCHADAEEARRRGLDGFRFFGYALGHHYIFGEHLPGRTSIWANYEQARDLLPASPGAGGIGTPDEIAVNMQRFEEAGVDQVVFLQQGGRNEHAHICASLELFAASVMPAFKARHAEREARKQAELAPWIERALARKRLRPALADHEIPLIRPIGGQRAAQESADGRSANFGRGSEMQVPLEDPLKSAPALGAGDTGSIAKANGIELCYDTFGNRDAAPLLLIMGLAAQMIEWDEEFCDELASRGYFVIRFDNRDIGLSTKLPQLGTPNVQALFAQRLLGGTVAAPYTLTDMAADAAALLDHLGIEHAHVVGLSMGGSIAQLMAIQHAERVLTLTSIMSSTGDPSLPPPKAEALSVLLTPAPADRAGYVQHYARNMRVLRGPGHELDEKRDLERAARYFGRGLNPPGAARQLAAILAAESRKESLKSVRAPTLVIHGSADPLVLLAGGKATADAIPGAKLFVVEGMGHALPRAHWPQLIDAIAAHAR
jgi:alkanesulfonate monooxygenase SsuD/methylene tetrahydromethanopterin reductase-like flavin-dependent oxidoreductase (luciferase family)/pimeloyl-ACP methyl ester carboxylesterase